MSGLAGFTGSLAFLVAIDHYGGGVPALRTPVADAEALADVLREVHDFEVKVLANEQASDTQRLRSMWMARTMAQVGLTPHSSRVKVRF